MKTATILYDVGARGSGRGPNRGGSGITDEQRLQGYYLPSFVEDPFGPLLSQLSVKLPPKGDTPVDVVAMANEMVLPNVQQQQTNATVPENFQDEHVTNNIPVVEDTKPHMPPKPVFDDSKQSGG